MSCRVSKLLRLRPYKDTDAVAILSWCKDEIGFKDIAAKEVETYHVLNEEWNCLALMIEC